MFTIVSKNVMGLLMLKFAILEKSFAGLFLYDLVFASSCKESETIMNKHYIFSVYSHREISLDLLQSDIFNHFF